MYKKTMSSPRDSGRHSLPPSAEALGLVCCPAEQDGCVDISATSQE